MSHHNYDRARRCVVASRAAAAAWSPASNADLSLWLKAPDLSAYEDAAKTDLCEDTDGVYTWAAASPTVYDAVQATGASRPTYTASYGGRPAVVGTGTRKLVVADAVPLRRTTSGYATPGVSVFGRLRANAVAGLGVAGKGGEWRLFLSGTGQLTFGDPLFGPNVASNANSLNGAWHYFVARMAHGGNWEIAVDAETPVTAATVSGYGGSSDMTLFANIYNDSIDGGLNEFGLYPRYLSDAERDLLRAYLAAG